MSEKQETKPAWGEADEFLRFKVLKGFRERGLPQTDEYLERIKFEGEVICQTQYAPYFLIVTDLCDFMRSRGIRFLVRGSGCGSCYVWGLGISHLWLDPIKYKLPFERFLNPSRVTMPDLDIDIQDDRRHEVVAYTVEKYGKDRVARIITFGTLGAKAAIKDLARALDLPNYHEVSAKLTSAIPGGKVDLEDAIAKSELLREAQRAYPQLFEMALRAEGKARNAGVHAAGVIIAPDTITKFCPTYFTGNPDNRSPSDWEPTTQWDMYDCEERGMLKMDYLGLKTLRVIDQSVKMINYIRQAQGLKPDFDVDTIARDDRKAWKLLSDGKLAGVFQVERQFIRNFAKRMSLMDMDPWRLAVLISIIRPGMMDAGTTDSYLRRAMGEEPPTPLHPKLEKTLKENFGHLVFQEDCMWVARDLAGFTLAEADNLRRAIAKKKPKDMAAIHPHFIKGCVDFGQITEAEAEGVWAGMVTFARYGFNNAHAAAYGLVGTYQTAYLKANHPLAFMTSLINSEAGVGDKERGYNAKVAEYVEEARGMGIEVLPPCVKRSGRMCSAVVSEGRIRFGLQMIKKVGQNAVTWVLRHGRQTNSFKEFALACYEVVQEGEKNEWKCYTAVGKTDVEGLIKAGALDVFDPDRERLLALSEKVLALAKKYWEQECKVRNGSTRLKLKPEDVRAELDGLSIEDDAVPHEGLEKRLATEREFTGCFLSDSPFSPFRGLIAQYDCTSEADLLSGEASGDLLFPGILRDFRVITVKNGKSKGKEMAFLTFSTYSADLEVVAFSDAWVQVRDAWKGHGHNHVERGKVYLVRARPDRNGGSVILNEAVRLSNTNYAA